MKGKGRKFIIGVMCAALGVFGLFGMFSEAEDKAALLGGSIILIIAGVVLVFLDKKFPDKPKPASQPTTTSKSEPYVFVTLHGKKFHYDPHCGGMRNPIKMDLSKAKKGGLTACDKCCFDYLHK